MSFSGLSFPAPEGPVWIRGFQARTSGTLAGRQDPPGCRRQWRRGLRSPALPTCSRPLTRSPRRRRSAGPAARPAIRRRSGYRAARPPCTAIPRARQPPVSASRQSTVTDGAGADQMARAAGAVQTCHRVATGAATWRVNVRVAKGRLMASGTGHRRQAVLPPCPSRQKIPCHDAACRSPQTGGGQWRYRLCPLRARRPDAGSRS